MKTSNKLIGIGYMLFILCFAAFFIAAKSSMIERENIEGSGVIETINFGPMTADIINLNGFIICELDPNSTDVLLTGDDNIIAIMENPINGNVFKSSGAHSANINISATVHPKFIIGTKGLKSLTIESSNTASILALDTLRLDNLRINASGNSKIDINVLCDRLSLTSSNHSMQDIKGSANAAILNSSNSSKLSAESFKVKEWDINLANYSKASIHATETIEGNISNNSKIDLFGDPASNSITTMNSAEINLPFSNKLIIK